MSGFTQKLGLVSVVAGLTLALSGCAIFVVENPGGVGSCDSHPVTLVTGQNASGDMLSVSYTGPDSAVLMLIPGGYAQDGLLDSVFDGEHVVWAWGDGALEGDVIRLDTTDPGWTVTGSGAATTYAFSGSAQELFHGAPRWDSFVVFFEMQKDFLPLAIAVDCDNTHDTGSIPMGEGWTFTAAQPLYPNSVLLNPFEVLTSALTPTGATATLRYSASAGDTLGSFIPGPPFSFQIYDDKPDVPNATMTNLWSQALIDAAPTGSMVVTGTNPDGSFNVDISGYNEGEALSDGNYLLITMIPNQDETAAKLIFSLFTYSAATGIIFGGAVASEPILADTGVSAWTAMVLAVAGAVAMASGATLLVVRRRHALAG
jgi:hypothetical protein